MFLQTGLDTFNIDDVTKLLVVNMLADLSEAELAPVIRLALLIVAVKQVGARRDTVYAADGFDHWRGVLVRITALVHLLLHAFFG